jgi:hypothetical protein
MRISFRRSSILFIPLFFSALNLFSAALNLPFQTIEPGVQYAHHWVPSVPWSVHIIRVDRHRGDLQLTTTLAQNKIFGLSPVPEQIGAMPSNGRAVAAINGDFFVLSKTAYQGDPRGLQIINGELVSAPSAEIAFWLDGNKPKMAKVISKFKVVWPDKTETPIGLNEQRAENRGVLFTPALGNSTRTTNGVELILERAGREWLPLRADEEYSARVIAIAGTNTFLGANQMVLSLGPKAVHPPLVPGMRVQISTEMKPGFARIPFAISGGPILVKSGKLAAGIGDFKEHKNVRNPRTAFGWNNGYFYFVVVDGRRKGVSAGMDFAELAKEMASLGCTDAMNFDGGGSSTLWAAGKVLNQPSDGHNRGVANALVCVRRK